MVFYCVIVCVCDRGLCVDLCLLYCLVGGVATKESARQGRYGVFARE